MKFIHGEHGNLERVDAAGSTVMDRVGVETQAALQSSQPAAFFPA